MPTEVFKTDPKSSSHQPTWTKSAILKGAVLLLLLGLAMVVTDPSFTFLDDETMIVDLAGRPAGQVMVNQDSGMGQLEHPPLSDLLFHYWLSAEGTSPRLVRLPAVLLYLAGLLILATVALKLRGSSAATALLWISVLWPFGFHFGRLAGWYSLAFFLVSLLTLAYLRCLEKPGWLSWLYFSLTALALVYTNYYGWAVIACLALDFLLRRRQRKSLSLQPFTAALLVVIAGYAPVMPAFLTEVLGGTSFHTPLSTTILQAAYNFYCLFVSESIAPWVWGLSVPLVAAIVISCVLTAVLISRELRFYFIYFALLYGVMAMSGLGTTKRLLFISPWLLLSLACALVNAERKKLRATLLVLLVGIAALGWFGTISRKYYASQHFLEPWQRVAEDAAQAIQQGCMVVSNSPSFFFYLNYALRDTARRPTDQAPRFIPGWAKNPRLFWVKDWNDAQRPTASCVYLITGVTESIDLEPVKEEA
jgi:hypothetical protein